MIAMTGAHIFVRSSLTLETVDWWQMLEFGVLLGIAIGNCLFKQLYPIPFF